MKVIIIGGGPAGMMASIIAAQSKAEVTLIEKNEKLGKKLFITGKGRCNITNCTPMSDFFNYIVSNPKFMYASLNQFSNSDCMDFFEKNGQKLKIERGNRVFPESDKSSDILNTFVRIINKNKVDVKLNEKLIKINVVGNKIISVTTDRGIYELDKLVLACGGVSYPSTGSTGEVLNMIKDIGHTIIPLKAGLTDIITSYAYDSFGKKIPLDKLPKIQGLSLKNVSANIINKDNNKVILSEFGEMLFTDKGMSGPIILTLSSYINRKEFSDIFLNIDLKPALSLQVLDERILRDFNELSNKQFKNALNGLLPTSLIPFVIILSDIDPDKKVNLITKEERARLANLLKNVKFSINGLGDISRAIITSGGVSTKEINPKSMQSKLFDNLYFAGEMMDIDALTGGFNLQLALSSGYSAGRAITEEIDANNNY